MFEDVGGGSFPLGEGWDGARDAAPSLWGRLGMVPVVAMVSFLAFATLTKVKTVVV